MRDLKDVARFSAAERRALLDKLLAAEVNGLTLSRTASKDAARCPDIRSSRPAVTKRGETVYVAGLNSAGKWTAPNWIVSTIGIRIAPQRKQLFSGMKGQPHAEENIAAYLTQKGWKGTRWSRAVVGDPTRKGVASFVCQNCQNMIRLVGGRIEPGLGGFS